jgi:YjjG family noncanonical pyrimidine nucleotidase
MSYQTITDVFFDLDHTLWDFDKNSVLAFDKIFSKYHPTINTHEFVTIYAPINQALWKLFQVDKITHEQLRYQRLKQTLDSIGYKISNEDIELISEKYIEYLPDNNLLFDGAIDVLDYLKPKYNLHIITNGFAEVQQRKLVASRLNCYFKTITNSEIAGVKKPHATIFEYALNAANSNKESAVMIGDCIEADVLGALQFGMKAILFDEKNHYKKNDVQKITHLRELKILL